MEAAYFDLDDSTDSVPSIKDGSEKPEQLTPPTFAAVPVSPQSCLAVASSQESPLESIIAVSLL